MSHKAKEKHAKADSGMTGPDPAKTGTGSGEAYGGADMDQAREQAKALLDAIDAARTALGNGQATTFQQLDGIKAGAASVLALLTPGA